jgi:hypothetical protein
MDLPDVARGAIIYLPVNIGGRCSTSATATPCRATASCAAWRWRCLPRSRCRSTSSRATPSAGRGWRPNHDHDHRQRPPAGGRRPHRLPRTRALGRRNAAWGEDEAYMLLTMCGKVRLGNMVDPKVHRRRIDQQNHHELTTVFEGRGVEWCGPNEPVKSLMLYWLMPFAPGSAPHPPSGAAPGARTCSPPPGSTCAPAARRRPAAARRPGRAGWRRCAAPSTA